MHNLLYLIIAIIHCSDNLGNSVYVDNAILFMKLEMFNDEIEKLLANKLNMYQIVKIQEACCYWSCRIDAEKDEIEEECNNLKTLYKDEVHDCLPER